MFVAVPMSSWGHTCTDALATLHSMGTKNRFGLFGFPQLLLPKDVGLDIGPCRPSASPFMWSLLPSGTGHAGSGLRRSLYICVAPSEQREEMRNFHTYKFIFIPMLEFMFISRSIAKQRDCSSLGFFLLSYQTVMLNNEDEIALENTALGSVCPVKHTLLFFFFPFSLACPPMRFFSSLHLCSVLFCQSSASMTSWGGCLSDS